MDNTTNQVPDQSVASTPRRRRISRTGVLWIAVSFSLLGIVTLLVWLQLATHALARAQVAEARAQAQVAESRRRLPQDTYNPTAEPNDRIPTQPNNFPLAGNALSPISGMPSAPSANGPYRSGTRIVEEQYMVPEVDGRTGRVEMVNKTRQTPVTVIEPSYSSNAEDTQEARVQQLALQYRNAELGQKESFSQALTQSLTELFDARHKAQSSRVEALKMEVQQTQELLDRRLQNKSKIIERRVKELTGQQDELSWNASVPNANPSSPRVENSPLQPPIQISAYDARTNSTVPTAGTPNPIMPSYSLPFTIPSDNFPSPSPSPASIPPTSPVFDNAPSQTIRASDLNVDESLPTPNANPTSVPTGASPISNNPLNRPLESQRSFMKIGFKLKGLTRQLEEEQTTIGITKVKNEIEETEAIWEFEKSSLQSELESAESEYQLVTKQLEQARAQVDIQRGRVNLRATADTKLDYSKAEVVQSEVERQLLQVRSRMTTLKKSIDWMENFFKDKPTSPPSTVAEPEALTPRY